MVSVFAEGAHPHVSEPDGFFGLRFEDLALRLFAFFGFADVGPGTHRLREVQQSGWAQTTTDPADITVVSGQDVGDIDFGNTASSSALPYDEYFNDGVADLFVVQ